MCIKKGVMQISWCPLPYSTKMNSALIKCDSSLLQGKVRRCSVVCVVYVAT